MKKIRNKFIILVFIWIILIVFIWIYKSFFKNSVDRNTYAILIENKWTINDKLITKNSKNLLKIWDVIKTIWDNSLAVIEWWDWSVTRLWSNSSIKIDELFVDEWLIQINLSFELMSWKSWSNVINFMWSKSYFKESFRDIEAWVRWTVFNIDLDNDYISVIKHKIALSWKNIEKISISENEPFSLKTFSLIELTDFIKNFKNKKFEELNLKFDEEFFEWLKIKINEKLKSYVLQNIENISILSQEKKQELYNSLLSKYQELNFVNSNDKDLFTKKLEYKEILISLAWDEEKVNLIENTFYDFKESIESKNYSNLDKILPLLNNNINILNKLNIDFWKYFNNIKLNDGLREAFWKNLAYLKNIFWVDFSNKFPDVSFEWIKQRTIDIYNTNVKVKLDEQVGFIKKFIRFLINK